MRRGALIGLVVLAFSGVAIAVPPDTENETEKATKTVLKDYLAPPIGRRGAAYSTSSDCELSQCHFKLTGKVDCRGVMQVREKPKTYKVWVSEMRCR